VALAAVGAEVHQALDAERHLAAQIALDHELGDLGADLLDLGVRQVLDLGGGVDPGLDADLARRARPTP
jgi:hypothetical protein